MLQVLLCVLVAFAAGAPFEAEDELAVLKVSDPNVQLLTFTGNAKGNVIGFNYCTVSG